MAEFGYASSRRLDTCHPSLQVLFRAVVHEFDCSVLEGHRSNERQLDLLNADPPRTTLGPGKSTHNVTPSRGIDVVPYPVDWDDTGRFQHFAGYVKGVAAMLGIKIIWGGDWKSFKDFPHFEIVE